MSSKKANNNPGLCPIKVQKSGLCTRTRARNWFSTLSLSMGPTNIYFLWVLLELMPSFWQKAVLRIPVTKTASNFANNYKEARLSGRGGPRYCTRATT